MDAPATIPTPRAELDRLRAIERAAWVALDMAIAGRAEDAYAVLSNALQVVTYRGQIGRSA
jgi:hypothetical protein